MLIQIIGSFLAVVSLSVIFGVPKKFIIYSGIAGAVGQILYFLIISINGSQLIAVFAAALVVAFLAHIMARLFKAPVTVFLVPGIIPTVPGLDMYRAVYNLIVGQNSLAQQHMLLALKIAGMIALAIFIIDSLFGLKRTKKTAN
ncbi:MAG: threonine/serine exporter [Eubacteriaceae bacterium]|nr:threonine/serine exporter [Eubacteriaceae bacterium]